MAIERKTVVDQIEITRDGSIGVRLGLLLVDGDKELSCKWHRTLIPLTVLPEDQLAYVNDHLIEMGEDTLTQEEIADVAAYHSLSQLRSAARVKG